MTALGSSQGADQLGAAAALAALLLRAPKAPAIVEAAPDDTDAREPIGA